MSALCMSKFPTLEKYRSNKSRFFPLRVVLITNYFTDLQYIKILPLKKLPRFRKSPLLRFSA